MFVLDCSAAAEIVRQSANGALFSAVLNTGERVISTDLFYPEISNTLWKFYKAGYLNETTTLKLTQQAIALVDEFYGFQDYFVEAIHEACRLNHPAYDFYYLLLAKRTGSALITCDKRLLELAVAQGVPCVSPVPSS